MGGGLVGGGGNGLGAQADVQLLELALVDRRRRVGHQVGGLLDLPHGVINGILLPHVIRYNARAIPARFRDLAVAVGLPVAGAPADEVAEHLSEYVRRLGNEVGVPRGLRDIGVSDDDIPRLARSTMQDACLTTNPRTAEAVDIEGLLRAAM